MRRQQRQWCLNHRNSGVGALPVAVSVKVAGHCCVHGLPSAFRRIIVPSGGVNDVRNALQVWRFRRRGRTVRAVLCDSSCGQPAGERPGLDEDRVPVRENRKQVRRLQLLQTASRDVLVAARDQSCAGVASATPTRYARGDEVASGSANKAWMVSFAVETRSLRISAMYL